MKQFSDKYRGGRCRRVHESRGSNLNDGYKPPSGPGRKVGGSEPGPALLVTRPERIARGDILKWNRMRCVICDTHVASADIRSINIDQSKPIRATIFIRGRAVKSLIKQGNLQPSANGPLGADSYVQQPNKYYRFFSKFKVALYWKFLSCPGTPS